MPSPIQLPLISDAERTPLVDQLVAQLEQLAQENLRQAEIIQQLHNEIAVLKGEKPKPTFKSSGMEENADPDTNPDANANCAAGGDPPPKRPGSAKRSQTQHLTIHQSRRRSCCRQGRGSRATATLSSRTSGSSPSIPVIGWRSGRPQRGSGCEGTCQPTSRAVIVVRPYARSSSTNTIIATSPSPCCTNHWASGVLICRSGRSMPSLLSGHNDAFFAEKDYLLVTGLVVSRSITVDDSGARHQGKNGYVTQIGTEWFTWFSSTGSKSRINFLELLQAGRLRYDLNEEALAYLSEQGLPQEPMRRL